MNSLNHSELLQELLGTIHGFRARVALGRRAELTEVAFRSHLLGTSDRTPFSPRQGCGFLFATRALGSATSLYQIICQAAEFQTCLWCFARHREVLSTCCAVVAAPGSEHHISIVIESNVYSLETPLLRLSGPGPNMLSMTPGYIYLVCTARTRWYQQLAV